MDTTSFVERFRRELRRIGLDEARSPYGVMASGSDETVVEFLAHVSTLPVGATWRDVYPDIPTHWDLADEETWTSAYRPLGPFDYPTLPCGPAVLIRLPDESTEDVLAQLSAAAALEGWVVYGSGFVPIENPDWPDRLAYVVLDAATTEPRYYEFASWIESRLAVKLAGCIRPVGTQFAPEPGT
jgi:hypothetical protein